MFGLRQTTRPRRHAAMAPRPRRIWRLLAVAASLAAAGCSSDATDSTVASGDPTATAAPAEAPTATPELEPEPTATPAPDPTATPEPPGAVEAGAIEIVVEGGAVVGGVDRVPVDAGTDVTITVTADVADEVHVHGYDLFVDTAPGDPATVTFAAGIPGIFEVELEQAGLVLVELEVS